ncbi:MAG TPA: PDGLE domain-containing protein [Anaerolineae bacterium]|nr:PDGLE domain-containing protein [Anaerolineae bacterium]
MRSVLWTVLGVCLACAIALGLAPFASESPDGLETVAKGAGFAERFEAPPTVASPMPDYTVPAVQNERIGTGLAGLIGALATAAIVAAVGWLLAGRRPPGSPRRD